MKLLFRLFLTLNLFLLCGSGLSHAHLFSGSAVATPTLSKEQLKTYSVSLDKHLRYDQADKGKDVIASFATEFEDENDEVSVNKKQTSKANPAEVFLNAWKFACRLPVANNNNLNYIKAPLAAALNKIYLAIQVLRL